MPQDAGSRRTMDTNTRDAIGWICAAVMVIAVCTALCVGIAMTSQDALAKRRAALDACTKVEQTAQQENCVDEVVNGTSRP